MNCKKHAPIFIVGFPRSGTTLLAAMLSSHPDIACGVETHFFSMLTDQDLAEAAGDPNWPEVAVQKVASLSSAGESLLSQYGITKNDLRTELALCPAQKQALLDGLLALYARRERKVIWLEKTPNHLAQLDRLRRLFPEARIIRIVRDPRDSLRSIFQLPWAPESILALAYDFRARHFDAQRFFNADPDSLTVKYEELVTQPESVLKQLCSFLQIQYDSRMLDTSRAGQKISSEREPWKNQVSSKLDTDRLYVWKREMDKKTACAIATVMSDFIEGFDYDPADGGRGKILPCMNMTSENIAARQVELIEQIWTGIIPIPVSFRDGLKTRSAAWLRGNGSEGNGLNKEKLLRAFNMTPWFSFPVI